MPAVQMLRAAALIRGSSASWSPDGKWIAFQIVFQRPAVIQGQQTQTEQIWVMNADGTGETRLTPVPGTDSMNL